jgi:hypothetical protein
MAHDLIDEYWLFINPCCGNGDPVFPALGKELNFSKSLPKHSPVELQVFIMPLASNFAGRDGSLICLKNILNFLTF